jgi:hypothetical protein
MNINIPISWLKKIARQVERPLRSQEQRLWWRMNAVADDVKDYLRTRVLKNSLSSFLAPLRLHSTNCQSYMDYAFPPEYIYVFAASQRLKLEINALI